MKSTRIQIQVFPDSKAHAVIYSILNVQNAIKGGCNCHHVVSTRAFPLSLCSTWSPSYSETEALSIRCLAHPPCSASSSLVSLDREVLFKDQPKTVQQIKIDLPKLETEICFLCKEMAG